MIIRSLLALALGLWSWCACAQVPMTLAGSPSPSTICTVPTTINVGANDNNPNVGSASASTTTVDAPAGSPIIVAIDFNTNFKGVAFTGLTDSAGNSYTIVQPAANASVPNAAIGYNLSVAHMPVGTSFTATASSGQWHMKGAVISCPIGSVDKSATLNQASANGGVSLSVSSLAATSDIAFGFSYPQNGGTVTTGTNFNDISNNSFIDFAFRNLTTNSVTYNPSWTNNVASSSVLVTFQASFCSQATTVNGRLDGSQNVSAVSTLVCGLITDGTYSSFDGIWIGAINSVANSKVDLSSNTHNITQTGTVNFSANNGWTSDGTTGYLSAFNPSTTTGLNLSTNTGSFGACDLTSRTAVNSTAWAMGAFDGSDNALGIGPLQLTGDGIAYYNENSSVDSGTTYAQTNVQGAQYVVGTAANTTPTIYINGSNAGGTSSGVTTTSLPNSAFTLLTIGGFTSSISPDQFAYFFIGGNFNSTQISNIYNRFHTYLTTVGASGGC